MQTRRVFLKQTGAMALGSVLLPAFAEGTAKIKDPGLQLYTFRKELLLDALGTLKQIASLGFKEIESASSEKGHYYGLKPKEMKQVCSGLGMTLRSGHIHLDDKWKQTLDEAAEAGQSWLICASMPAAGQSVDNYKRAGEIFNKSGEDCKKMNIQFGYHNHDAEFEQENGKILYEVLLENTDPSLVKMELDLGWVIAAGKDPLDYFGRYPGRFPLWHLKDMDLSKKQSTEFGKGSLPIKKLFEKAKQSGMQYFFVEQEDYSHTAFESMQYDMEYLRKLK